MPPSLIPLLKMTLPCSSKAKIRSSGEEGDLPRFFGDTVLSRLAGLDQRDSATDWRRADWLTKRASRSAPAFEPRLSYAERVARGGRRFHAPAHARPFPAGTKAASEEAVSGCMI